MGTTKTPFLEFKYTDRDTANLASKLQAYYEAIDKNDGWLEGKNSDDLYISIYISIEVENNGEALVPSLFTIRIPLVTLDTSKIDDRHGIWSHWKTNLYKKPIDMSVHEYCLYIAGTALRIATLPANYWARVKKLKKANHD